MECDIQLTVLKRCHTNGWELILDLIIKQKKIKTGSKFYLIPVKIAYKEKEEKRIEVLPGMKGRNITYSLPVGMKTGTSSMEISVNFSLAAKTEIETIFHIFQLYRS